MTFFQFRPGRLRRAALLAICGALPAALPGQQTWTYTPGSMNILSAAPSSLNIYDRGDGCCADFRMHTLSGQETHFYTYGAGYFGIHKYGSGSANGQVLTITPMGNLGIGTANPQYLLSVNGTIGTKDILVTNSGWSDYVFRPGYRLRPLSEVNAFIQTHHHLPDIPSEAEVKEKGVSLGEMQAKLLAKIEELTLHMIQSDQSNQRLERQNRELQGRIARLEAHAAH